MFLLDTGFVFYGFSTCYMFFQVILLASFGHPPRINYYKLQIRIGSPLIQGGCCGGAGIFGKESKRGLYMSRDP